MAEETTFVCKEHNIRQLPRGFKRCPICEEQQRIEAEALEYQMRDTSLEPY